MGEFGGRTFQEGETAGAKTLRWRHGDQCRMSEENDKESIRTGGRRQKGGEILQGLEGQWKDLGL